MRKTFINAEESKDVVLERRKAELDSLSVAINESKRELGDMENTKKDKIKELARVVKAFDENDTLMKSRIDSLKGKSEKEEGKLDILVAQVNELITTRNEVQEEIDSLKGVLAGKKAQIDSDTLEYEKVATKKSKVLAKLISDQTGIYDELSAQVELLREESIKLSTNVANGNALIKDAYAKINELESREMELDTNIKTKIDTVFTITSDIEKKDMVLTVLGEKEEATQEAIVELNKRKDALLEQVAVIEKERSDFYREKLAFHEVKQLILTKEVYIKEKFEQAGIKYS